MLCESQQPFGRSTECRLTGLLVPVNSCLRFVDGFQKCGFQDAEVYVVQRVYNGYLRLDSENHLTHHDEYSHVRGA